MQRVSALLTLTSLLPAGNVEELLRKLPSLTIHETHW